MKKHTIIMLLLLFPALPRFVINDILSLMIPSILCPSQMLCIEPEIFCQ